MTFGTCLRALRLSCGYSLRELAERAYCDYTYLSKFERGKLPPPSEELIWRLAKALYADYDELLAKAGKLSCDIKDYILSDPNTLDWLRQKVGPRKLEVTRDGVMDQEGVVR